MIASFRSRRSLAAMPLLAALLVGASGALAQEQPWDQARVTELAGAFAEAATELKDALRREGNPTVASMQARAHHELVDQVRLITREAQHLTRELEAGRSHDQTFSVFRRIEVLIRDAQSNARRLHMKEQVQEKIDAAGAALNQLRPYYAEA